MKSWIDYIYNFRELLNLLDRFCLKFCDKIGFPVSIYTCIKMFLIAVVFFIFAAITVMIVLWIERRVSARFQSRIGPNRVGFEGTLQPIADTIKLLGKEIIVPAGADKIVHFLAPIVVFTVSFLAYICLPFGPGLIATDLNLGILYIFAISSVAVVGILMAGWGSNNKYSMLGGMRATAQIISYEVPLVLSVVGVLMHTNTLRLSEIVHSQGGGLFNWFIFRQPVAFIIYIIAAIAEINRTPFDIPEAESELTAGYHTEYSGIRFAFFFLAEFTNMFLISGIATCIFLGGWHGFHGLPPWCWFLGKCYCVMFILMWFRWTFPRLRVDQLMNLSWKVLTPIALLNILVTGISIFISK
ncbi:MAG: NADH-quinone oxidoreductase subunit NuoH [Candidatus Stahlbacteria bacterium]|nr:NADH-quinone oxidoreductase subunit NuoH [Candidatus Stahlbacteria bacterium]